MCEACEFFKKEFGDDDNNEIYKLLKKKHAQEGKMGEEGDKKKPSKGMLIDMTDTSADPLERLDKINCAFTQSIEKEFWNKAPESLTLMKLRRHAYQGALDLVNLRIQVMEAKKKG